MVPVSVHVYVAPLCSVHVVPVSVDERAFTGRGAFPCVLIPRHVHVHLHQDIGTTCLKSCLARASTLVPLSSFCTV